MAVIAPPPVGYRKLAAGVRCGCFKLWTDGKGGYWCCQQAGYAPMEPHADGCKPLTAADREAMDREAMELLRKLVANQGTIIELLRDISMGLA